MNLSEAFCINNHAMSPQNTRRVKTWKICKTCHRQDSARHYRRKQGIKTTPKKVNYIRLRVVRRSAQRMFCYFGHKMEKLAKGVFACNHRKCGAISVDLIATGLRKKYPSTNLRTLVFSLDEGDGNRYLHNRVTLEEMVDTRMKEILSA